MIKEIALIKKKQGLSTEEFRRYYEEIHAPMMKRFCPTIKRYARNYVVRNLQVKEEVDFDCVTEVWYDDMEGFNALVKIYTGDEGKPIHESEEKFMDSKPAVVLVDEQFLQ